MTNPVTLFDAEQHWARSFRTVILGQSIMGALNHYPRNHQPRLLPEWKNLTPVQRAFRTLYNSPHDVRGSIAFSLVDRSLMFARKPHKYCDKQYVRNVPSREKAHHPVWMGVYGAFIDHVRTMELMGECEDWTNYVEDFRALADDILVALHVAIEERGNDIRSRKR